MSEYGYLQKYDCQNEFVRENVSNLSLIDRDAKWIGLRAGDLVRHLYGLRIIPGYELRTAKELDAVVTELKAATLAVMCVARQLKGETEPTQEAAE